MKERPEDPVEFLAVYLQKNNPNKNNPNNKPAAAE